MKKLFTVRDSKAEAYFPPQVYATTGEAIRALQLNSKNPDSMLGKFPLDYALIEIGEWDEQQALILPYPTPKNVGLVADLVTQ